MVTISHTTMIIIMINHTLRLERFLQDLKYHKVTFMDEESGQKLNIFVKGT